MLTAGDRIVLALGLPGIFLSGHRRRFRTTRRAVGVRRAAHLITAAAAMAALVGCTLSGTVGSGPTVSENRTVAEFDRIEVDAGIAVEIQIGPVQSVQVQAQQEVLPRITTEVASGVLKIHHASAFVAAQTPHVAVVTPALNGVAASGGSQVTADGIAADTFDVNLNGGSTLTATGTANAVAVQVNGGARASLFGLLAKTVFLDVNGGSNADVNASVAVTGSVNGGSSATVAGGGAINASANGGSSIGPQ